MYAGSKYESHYTVWTAWISIRVRVRVRVYFILQNLAPLALPYMYVPTAQFSVISIADIRSAFDKTLASERFRRNAVDGAP